jgi:glycosyltransferase involved in cell wall biosynthesis
MRIAILANVPVWTLPGLEHLRHHRHYATWLEPLIPEFAAFPELEIHWITMCKETERDLTHRMHGQTFHILSRGSMAVQMASGYATEILRIRKTIRSIRPDLVHAWGSEDVYGLAGSFSGVKKRIFTLQGCLTEYLRLLGGSALFRLQAMYEKPMIRRYKYATAESPAAAVLLRGINPKLDIELVDYGVNPDFFSASWKPSPQPELLFLGSISKRKGIADLIAVAKLPELSHIRFRIAGEGELRAELEATSTPNVEWLGKCGREEVIRHMESAWGMVIPTYSDTGPTVIKEARVIGLPIITTTGAGAACYVTEGKSGFVGVPGDRDFLKTSLLQLTTNRAKAIEMGKVDHAEQREQLHPRTTARKLADLYLRQRESAER